VRVLLRESHADPFVVRLLVQALLPGLVNVAKKLRWGQGGVWVDADDFFGELVATAWAVLQEWSGQDRPYAVLDLLSAIRCRMQRQLFRAKDDGIRVTPIDPGEAEHLVQRPAPPESDLEGLARILVELHEEGMRTDEVRVLYAQHVLGYSIAELSAMTGRNRRFLYTRRDRGRRRVQASVPDLLTA
jgi:DNA-directed RNA polymerase specialized sigma24 family protein